MQLIRKYFQKASFCLKLFKTSLNSVHNPYKTKNKQHERFLD